jgi:hypothetical protein
MKKFPKDFENQKINVADYLPKTQTESSNEVMALPDMDSITMPEGETPVNELPEFSLIEPTESDVREELEGLDAYIILSHEKSVEDYD